MRKNQKNHELFQINHDLNSQFADPSLYRICNAIIVQSWIAQRVYVFAVWLDQNLSLIMTFVALRKIKRLMIKSQVTCMFTSCNTNIL
jgi:hypothetical protein